MNSIVDKKVEAFLGNRNVHTEYVPITDLDDAKSVITHDGIVCENGSEAWFVSNDVYMAGLLNISRVADFGVPFMASVAGVNVLPCRRNADGRFEFFLTAGNPFGAYGKGCLRLLTKDWFYDDALPNGRVLCQKAYAPNLARVGGMYLMQWVEVDANWDSPDGVWVVQEELPTLLAHESACLAEVHFAVNFVRADIFGIFGGTAFSETNVPDFFNALQKLEAMGKPSFFKRVSCTRKTDWQIRKPNQRRGYGVGHKDGKFFVMTLMRSERNGAAFEMIGLLEEVVEYTEVFCEKVIGWTQLPVRIDEQGKAFFGLVPWNVPGNCGQTVYVCPRRSQSNVKQLVTVPADAVWKQYAVHTYATAIGGKVECLLFKDTADSLIPEVVWFSASALKQLFFLPQFCDVMTLNNVFHAVSELSYHLPHENPLS